MKHAIKTVFKRMGHAFLAWSVFGSAVLVFVIIAQISDKGMMVYDLHPGLSKFLLLMVFLYGCGYLYPLPKTRKVPFFAGLFAVLASVLYALDGSWLQLAALVIVLGFIMITMPFFFPAVILMTFSLIKRGFKAAASRLFGTKKTIYKEKTKS